MHTQTSPNGRSRTNAAALAAALLLGAVALALSVGHVSAEAGTDVSVATPEIAFSTTTPVDGSNATIFITVRNVGTEDATSVQVTASLTTTGELLGQTNIGFIAAQSQVDAAIAWNVSGEGNVTVTVAATPSEVDSNTVNNQAVSVNVFIRSRPDLRVDSVSFDNPAPPPGTPAVSVTAVVSNIGGSDASYVRVAFFDGVPASTNKVYETTVLSVKLNLPQSVSFVWSLGPSAGGRHDVYARVEASIPTEKAGNLLNNMASGRLLVLTNFDYIITGAVTLESTPAVPNNPLCACFIIVRAGGELTLRNATFTILQDRENQFDVIVESGGRLNLWSSTITSDFPFGITLQSAGVIALHTGSKITGGIASTGGEVSSYDSEINGDLTGRFSKMWLENSTLLGGVSVASTTATWISSRIDSTSSASFTASSLTVEWADVAFGGDSAISLTGGSIGVLRGLSSGPVFVEAGSSASIWRLAAFTVSDLSGIPIPGAVVVSSFSLNATAVSTVTTDITGHASTWLLTDLLYGGSPQYVGSYHFTATFASYHADVIENLPFYPTLNGDANRIALDLVFPVIDPTDLFTNATGQQIVTGQWDLVDFRQDGNLYVRGVLNIDGTFTLDQDWDYQKAIVVDSGSVNLGPAGSISSPFRFNIYLFNESAFNADGGSMDLNAIVTFGNSAVSIAGGTQVRSSFILAGTSFQLGTGVVATGAKFYGRVGTSVIVEGATVSMTSVDVLTDGSVSINDSALNAFGDVSIRSTGVGHSVSIHNSLLSGSDLALQGALIDIVNSQFLFSTISLMWGDVVQIWNSAFFSPVTGFKPSSTASLYDATYPSLVVDPTAVVIVHHKLSVRAVDSNGNAVTSGTWTINHLPDNAVVAEGSLSTLVERDLVASRIIGGVETFDGNYKLTVTSAGGDSTRYVVMDQARLVLVTYPQEIVAPNALVVLASADPAVFVQGSTITIGGSLGLSYEGRDTLLPPAHSVDVKLAWNGSVFATTASGTDGVFSWTGAFAPDPAFYGVTLINITADYGTVQGRASISVNVTEAPPTGLLITLDHDRFEKGTNENFVISGSVRYSNGKPAEGARIRVTFTIPPQAGEYTAVVNGAGIFDVNVPGRRTASTYSLVVNAHDDQFNIDAQAKTVTLAVSALTGTNAGAGLGGLTGWILIGAAIAAGVIVGLFILNAKRTSVNYVECGNCGRPAHEGDKKCPSCGVEFEEDIAKCSHCASWIPSNAVRCPKCNTEFKPVDDSIAGAPVEAPETAAPEGVKAEVTAPAAVQKAPVAVKKKVMKTAETAPADGPKYENPWDQPGAKSTQPIQPGEDKPAETPPKKPEEKKEKGLFDDL